MLTCVLTCAQGAIWSMAVRPDGKGFVTGSADKTVKFWDVSVCIFDELLLLLQSEAGVPHLTTTATCAAV